MDTAIQAAAVGGPVILALMGLYVSIRPPIVTGKVHWVWFSAFAIVGVIATFANFVELHGADTLQQEIKAGIDELRGHNSPAQAELEKRVAMKELIGEALDDADKLNANWWKRNDDDQFKHETNLWINKAGHLIEDAYGEGEAKAWNDDAGITNYTDGKKHTDLHNAIMNRAARLKAFMPRVDILPMRQSFDPKNYRWVETCDGC
jgi:hypothetical protein